MEERIVSGAGEMVCHCIRLRRGEDLLESIRRVCKEKNIHAGVILSGVGCLLRGRIRDASGVNIREITDHCEIVSLNGTVSAQRCHVHIALSFEDMHTVGGHLSTGLQVPSSYLTDCAWNQSPVVKMFKTKVLDVFSSLIS